MGNHLGDEEHGDHDGEGEVQTTEVDHEKSVGSG